MSSIQIGILIFIGYLMLYSIVDRICNSVEKCNYYYAVTELGKVDRNESSEHQEKEKTED